MAGTADASKTMQPDNGARFDRLLRMAVWGGAAALFLLPAIAMQFTKEVNWTTSDFVAWGSMLLAALSGFELTMRASSNWTYRAAGAVAIGAAFMLLWSALAVGIIGRQDDLYVGVLLIGIAGAIGAGRRAQAMVRVMTTMGLATVLIGVIAVASRWGVEGASWPQVVIIANGVFTGAWFLSAWLFSRAAKQLAIPS